MWLYPLPCLLALIGWSYMYLTAAPLFIALGLVTLLVGGGAFLRWSWRTGGWPFQINGRNLVLQEPGSDPPST